jgi:hypothetical protein
VEVNIVNNASSAKVTQGPERRGPEGQRSIDIMIDESVANQLSRSGSASSRAMRNIYGSSPVLTGR